MSARKSGGRIWDILKPWTWTGVSSSPEYLPALPAVGEYRKWSPASPPAELLNKLSIPRREPEHIFNIEYHVRDQRRKNVITGTRQEVLLVQKCGAENLPYVPIKAGVPPPPGPNVKFSSREGYAYENEGYT